MKRKEEIYRRLLPVSVAKDLYFRRFAGVPRQKEHVSVREALGRVTASPVKALRSVPGYHSAAMDGIAVRAARTFGAMPERPVVLKKHTEAIYVDTGDPLPPEADAVVMIEKVEEVPEGWEVREAVYPWQQVRKVGEDIVKGETILPARHRITAYDQGAMLAAGVLSVEVFKQPRVVIIPTGDEVVRPEDAPDPLPAGMIVECNGQIVASLVQSCGGVPTLLPPCRDDLDLLTDRVTSAISDAYDLILILAGSSTGSGDLTPSLLARVGEVIVHGVAVMPGKPAILAVVNDRPVVGIPGYPVSAVICVREFVQPLLHMFQGLEPPEAEKTLVTVGRKIPSKLGLEEHVRVCLGKIGSQIVAVPLASGAGRLSSLMRADGLIKVPLEVGGLSQGELVEAEILTSRRRIENNLLMVGSHDLTVDLLSSLLSKKTGGVVRLSSSNVGSLGGLLALKSATAHLAGSHLLDPETGEYNVSYVKKILQGVPHTVMTLVHRWQGFMVQPGNPKGIKGIRDLVRPDVVFVNRQPGSGTRILLDQELRKAFIDPDKIAGYHNEEYTHMNVGIAVMSGAADVGMGINAAAIALGLDFLPVTLERYDVIIPTALLNDARIELLIDVIRSDAFKAKVLEMGGYEVGSTGSIVVQIE